MNRGLIEMIIATFIWGSTPLMGIFSHLPSGVFVFFRVLFAFWFLLYFSIRYYGLREFLNIKHFLPLLLSGVALAINWIFFFWALEYSDVSTVVIIYYSGPIISLLLASIFLKERINFYIILGVILAFLGVVVSSNGFTFNKGAILAIFAAISYGLLGFFSKIATIYHKALIVTTWQILISIFITLPYLFLQEWHFSINAMIIALITAIVHTAIALFLWYDALKYIKVSIASILQYLDIVFSMILAYIFLDQIPLLNQIIGAILIVVAGILVTFKRV
ncbi:MAG: DMT family transporter [Epsilonproteobacteria bacterium]|nr:DMT family transporter [Campylobacterota bacterium]